jgi:hypothetical protein
VHYKLDTKMMELCKCLLLPLYWRIWICLS